MLPCAVWPWPQLAAVTKASLRLSCAASEMAQTPSIWVWQQHPPCIAIYYASSARLTSFVCAADCVEGDSRLAARASVNPHGMAISIVHIEVFCIYARNGNSNGVTLHKNRE